MRLTIKFVDGSKRSVEITRLFNGNEIGFLVKKLNGATEVFLLREIDEYEIIP